MALKITVDSFDINQYLLFSNVYAISLYLSYLILFDRQTNRPTYQERHRSSDQEVKKFMGKRFSMNLTFSSFLPFPLSPPHNHHPDPPPLLSPPLPPHPLPLPSPPPSTSPTFHLHFSPFEPLCKTKMGLQREVFEKSNYFFSEISFICIRSTI